MTPTTIASLFAQATLDPRTLGLTLEHHQAQDGIWQTTLPTEDLLLLLDLALNPKAAAST